MLLAISRPPIAITATDDPVIEALVNLMPDYSAGRRLHDLYVNKLQSVLPGNYSQMFGTGPPFRRIFFPGWQADPLLSLAGGAGDDAWWSGFSVAVLCQAIREMASHIRGQMMADKINGDVSSFNATLRGRSFRVYANVLAATFNPLIALLQQVNPNTAKQQFHDSLLNNVLNRQLWFQAGMWTSPDWEMFNQYVKYIALGASDAEVDTLIGELMAAGLPVPPQVNQGAWRSYAEELRDKPNVDVNDIRSACSGPVTTATWMQGGRQSVEMPNGNCYEFTARSQPGIKYRQLPGGCCFTGDTQVLDGAGNTVPLRRIKPGDTVLTRDGTATVAYVAQPLRAERKLYSITGGGPVFVTTHPFLNGAPPNPADAPPKVLALEPRSLAWSVPTLSEDGIGTLGVGSTLWSRVPGVGKPPVIVTVAGIEEVTGSDDTYLYDLRLVTSSGTRQEFWAGQGGTFYLVSPEYPILDQAGAAATAVVAVMEGLFKAGGPDERGWPSWIIDAVNQFGAGVFHGALMEALASTPSFDAPMPPGPIYERIDRLYRGLDTATAETAAVVASLFDGLMSAVGQWLASIVTLGWRMSMLLGGNVLAVTVFDIVLTPTNPIPADTLVQLDVTVKGRTLSDVTCMWDRRGRGNTRFHHYFDQLVHLDMAGEDRPDGLSFAVSIHGAPIPTLFAEAPGAVGESSHRLQSAVLRDSTGTVVGTIRFDTRRLGRDAASQELAHSGLWTEDAANAYANALGAAMVEPILSKLREMAPIQKS
jgi:hypothetical protein